MINAVFTSTLFAFTKMPGPAITSNVLVAVISPPPVSPAPAVIVTAL